LSKKTGRLPRDFLATCLGLRTPTQGSRPMEITDSFLTLLQNFAPVFTAPTYQTFVVVVTILAPGATFFWAVDDTLCRKRGLTLYGAGMHYDPLISSRAKSLVSWGHDWVVLTLIVAFPAWAPSKVFALPIAMRLYRNRQGLTKGKKNP